jgi:hypothetical protein
MADTDIQLELKVKHFYLVAEALFSTAASDSFETLNVIKNACAGFLDDDLVSILISPSRVFDVYKNLTFRPEGQFNRVNNEMFDLLVPQMQAGVASGNQQWIDLYSQIEGLRTANLSVVDIMIVNAKAKLGQ